MYKMSLAFALAILGGFTSMVYIAPQLIRTTFVQSSIDQGWYKVQKGPNQQKVADTLARLRKRMYTLVSYCIDNGPKQWAKPLSRLNLDAIAESEENVGHVAYTVNKGEAIHFCIQKPQTQQKTQKTPNKQNTQKGGDESLSQPLETNMNTLMYVAIHEIAHVVTKSTGHTEEFWQNHARLLRLAEKAGVYKDVDYQANPTSYCGVRIETPSEQEKEETM